MEMYYGLAIIAIALTFVIAYNRLTNSKEGSSKVDVEKRSNLNLYREPQLYRGSLVLEDGTVKIQVESDPCRAYGYWTFTLEVIDEMTKILAQHEAALIKALTFLKQNNVHEYLQAGRSVNRIHTDSLGTTMLILDTLPTLPNGIVVTNSTSVDNFFWMNAADDVEFNNDYVEAVCWFADYFEYRLKRSELNKSERVELAEKVYVLLDSRFRLVTELDYLGKFKRHLKDDGSFLEYDYIGKIEGTIHTINSKDIVPKHLLDKLVKEDANEINLVE